MGSSMEAVNTLCNEMRDDATTVFNDKIRELTRKYLSKEIDEEKFITDLDEYNSFYKNFCEKIKRVKGLCMRLDNLVSGEQPNSMG